MHLSPPPLSKVVLLLLLIYLVILVQLWGFRCVLVALLCNTLCPFLLGSHFDGEERAASFTLIVFLIARDCYCSIAFPRGAVDWSAVHDCGISSSDSLINLVLSCNGLYIFISVLFAEIQVESSG